MPSRVRSYVDKLTKWVTTALVFGVGCAHTTPDNVLPPFFLLWALCTAILGKIIKRFLAHARPPTARRRSHGMPSSHANSLACLSSIASIAMLGYDAYGVGSCALGAADPSSAAPWPRHPAMCGAFIIAPVVVAAGLTILRVTEGHHTVSQVAAGWLLGSASAAVAFGVEVHWLHVNDWHSRDKHRLVAVALAVAGLSAARAARTWTFHDG